MQIRELEIAATNTKGLAPGRMKPLNRLVILAGPNGGGKTRLLDYVSETARFNAGDMRLRREQSKDAVATEDDESVWHGRGVTLVGQGDESLIQHYLPRSHRLRDSGQLSDNERRDSATRLGQRGVSQLESHTSSYATELARTYFQATHPELKAGDAKKAVDTWMSYQTIVGSLLGVKPECALMDPTLRGKRLAQANLSPGESYLLQLATALHAQSSQLDRAILFLDEPELHLHPKAVIDVIDRLREATPRGQIWVATHSLALLAHIDQEDIWFVQDSRVSWAGRSPERVLESLTGGAAGRERLHIFLQLPSALATSRFAAECLLAPATVAESGHDDPQVQQVNGVLGEMVKSRGTVRVLDFGAGEGRLFAALFEAWTGQAAPFSEHIDYHAYEPKPTSERLATSLHKVYGGEERAHFDLEVLSLERFDLVVLCNVLHEIDPREWESDLFGSNGIIRKLLKDDGLLLFVEDYQMPVGERAHEYGFLLLDRPSLVPLFACSDEEAQQIVTLDDRGGRLKAHQVPAAYLGRTRRAHVQLALSVLAETAEREARRLRMVPDSGSGRLFAMWTQLYFNARTACADV